MAGAGQRGGTGRRPGSRSARWDRNTTWITRWADGFSRRGRIAAWIALMTTGILIATSLVAYAGYLRLNGNLNVIDPFGGLHGRPPPSQKGVINILLLGSQTRDGQGPGFGHDPGTDLSDNLILVHIDADHAHATVVSIPRDMLAYRPACKARTGGGTVPAEKNAMIDAAMSLGGPACAVATVEDLTHIRMDHFIRFTFNSFRTMTNVLGGVNVCLKQPVNDPYSHLRMSAGEHLVTGNQALAFVRTRHGVGNGGDLGRIQLQQEFMSSLAQKVESQRTLYNPVKMYQIANAATKALAVDPGLGTVGQILHMGAGLRNLRSKDITFVTLPTAPDATDSNRLDPQQPQDDLIWQLLRADQPWGKHLPKTPAGRVQVQVLNGTGVTGLAGQAASGLRQLGFGVTGTGNAQAPTANTTVSYPAGQAGAAGTLGGALNNPPAYDDGSGNGTTGPAVATASSNTLTLTLGADFGGVKAGHAMHPRGGGQPGPGNGQPGPGSGQPGGSGGQEPVQTRNGAQNICSGLPSANPNA